MLECGTKIRNSQLQGGEWGTAGCLLRPTGRQSPNYILTAAHVIAPTGFGVTVGNSIVDNQTNPIGRLVAFTDAASDGVDSAIIELDVEADPTQGAYGIPTGWGNAFWDNMAMRAQAGSTGSLRVNVKNSNADVTLPYPSPAGPTPVVLRAQIWCDRNFLDGDSGTAALNPYGSVVGMIIANYEKSGIVTPIMAILAALNARGFDLEPVVDRSETGAILLPPSPVLSGSNTSLSAAPWADAVFIGKATVEIGKATVEDEATAIDVLARTLWAEADVDFQEAVDQNNNHIGDKAFRAVAEVVVNRARKPGWWGYSIASVCKACVKGTYQFSSWDPKNPQYKYIGPNGPPKSQSFETATAIATSVAQGWSGNLTLGAYNYYADYALTPKWAKDLSPCAHIGHHLFFNNVP